MTVSYTSQSTDTTLSSNQLDFPSVGVDADRVLVHASWWWNTVSAVQAVTTPVGWTEVFNGFITSTSSRRLVIAYREGEPSHPATYAWTVPDSTNLNATGVVARYDGVTGGVEEALQDDASAEDATAPSIADGASGDMLVTVHAGGEESIASLVFSTPTGMTLRQGQMINAGPDVSHVLLSDVAISASGATGAQVADQAIPGTNVSRRIGWSILLRAVPLVTGRGLVVGSISLGF